METTVSPVLRELLYRQRMSAGTAGTVEAHGIADGGNAGKSAPRHQPAGQEENQPILVWTNMTLTQRTEPRGRVRLVSAT